MTDEDRPVKLVEFAVVAFKRLQRQDETELPACALACAAGHLAPGQLAELLKAVAVTLRVD